MEITLQELLTLKKLLKEVCSMATKDVGLPLLPICLKRITDSSSRPILITGAPGFGSGYHLPHLAAYVRRQLESKK
jgi:hypothetical protein